MEEETKKAAANSHIAHKGIKSKPALGFVADSSEITQIDHLGEDTSDKITEVTQLRAYFQQEQAAVKEVLRLRALIQTSFFKLSDIVEADDSICL